MDGPNACHLCGGERPGFQVPGGCDGPAQDGVVGDEDRMDDGDGSDDGEVSARVGRRVFIGNVHGNTIVYPSVSTGNRFTGIASSDTETGSNRRWHKKRESRTA